jgi:hypothetical protein
MIDEPSWLVIVCSDKVILTSGGRNQFRDEVICADKQGA